MKTTKHGALGRLAIALAAIGMVLCAVTVADAKGTFSHMYDSDPKGTISDAERRALLDFYASTGGDSSWDKHDAWNGPPGSECGWFGITCNHEHVIKIELGDNHLKGTLPDISALGALDYLDIRGNQLGGSLAALEKLPSLRGVVVSGNAFSGTLPDLSALRALQLFRAGSNKLSGEIPPLTGLTKLQYFAVDNNALSGPIPALDGLTQLQSIDLNDNRLSGTIPALAELTSLSAVDFSRNRLTGPIPPLNGLSNLRSIKLDHNALQGDVPDAPVPNALDRAHSGLCPNRLAAASNVQWDRATGSEPWYSSCTPAEDSAPVKISAPIANPIRW